MASDQIIVSGDISFLEFDVAALLVLSFAYKKLEMIVVKPLGVKQLRGFLCENHELAVCLFNKSNKPREMSISLAKLHSDPFVDLPIKSSYEATNLWEKESFVRKPQDLQYFPGLCTN